jgi:hypothetical protein
MTQRTAEQCRGVGGKNSRAAAWLAWSLVALSVALLVGGLVLSRAASSTVADLQFGGETKSASVVADLVTLLIFSVVGAVIVSRQPRNTIGWLFCGVGVAVSLNSFAGDYAEFWLTSGFGMNSLGETAAWFSSWLWILLVSSPIFLLLLFPDGRLPSPRWRPVAWCAALGITGFTASLALGAGPLEDFPQIVNPYSVDSPIVGIVGVAAGVVAIGSMVASAISLIVRLRRAEGEQRQQVKWLAYGGAMVVGTILVGGVITIWSVTVSIVVMNVALLGLPVFTGIAIVKHRLYDIDILINRTLVYGFLTATLALIYFGGVVGLQYVFRALTAQGSTLAVVASTLVIAALFNPLGRRVQGFVDRRFYRRKYDAAKTLAAFNTRLREETDLEALRDHVVEVVRATMQPEHVSLWLSPETAPQREQAG